MSGMDRRNDLTCCLFSLSLSLCQDAVTVSTLACIHTSVFYNRLQQESKMTKKKCLVKTDFVELFWSCPRIFVCVMKNGKIHQITCTRFFFGSFDSCCNAMIYCNNTVTVATGTHIHTHKPKAPKSISLKLESLRNELRYGTHTHTHTCACATPTKPVPYPNRVGIDKKQNGLRTRIHTNYNLEDTHKLQSTSLICVGMGLPGANNSFLHQI